MTTSLSIWAATLFGRTKFAPVEGSAHAEGVLIVATVLFFFVIKPVNTLLARLRTEPPVAEETHQCPECLSEIPIAARRCAFCTTQVVAAR
jgi:hypothetical protein